MRRIGYNAPRGTNGSRFLPGVVERICIRDSRGTSGSPREHQIRMKNNKRSPVQMLPATTIHVREAIIEGSL